MVSIIAQNQQAAIRTFDPMDQEGDSRSYRDQRSGAPGTKMTQPVHQEEGSAIPIGSAIPEDQATFWLKKIKFRPAYRAMLPVVAGWEDEKKKAPNVYQAIMFLSAYQVGDIDGMLEFCPGLGSMTDAIAKRAKKKRVPLLDSLGSSSIDSHNGSEDLKRKEEKGIEEIEIAICEITLCDPAVSRKVRALAKRLCKAEYTAEHIRAWYTGYYLVSDWRFKDRGEVKPTLAAIEETIGWAKGVLPVASPEVEQTSPPPPPSACGEGVTPAQALATPVPESAPVADLEPEIDEATQTRIAAICKVTRKVFELDPDDVLELAFDLGDHGGFTADEILGWERRCYRTTWPGNQQGSRPPGLKDIRKRIGEVRELPAEGADRYLEDEYFQRREDDLDNPFEEAPPPRPTWQGNRAATVWFATMGHFEVSLGRATFEAWVKNTRLVDVSMRDDGTEVFVALVRRPHQKDWIERHFLHSLEKVLSDWCNHPAVVQIELEEGG
jgi:hypothetical protein